MPIKRRPTTDPATEAAIEAFGEAAERPAVATAVTTAAPAVATPRPSTPRTAPKARAAAKPRKAPVPTPAAEWPEDLAKTLLIRYPDMELPMLLAEVAQLVDRSQHATALRALRRGLEVLKDESGS